MREQLSLAGVLADPDRRAALAWAPFRDGVEVAWLYRADGGPQAAFLRYAPGARVPPHHHAGFEHILVLEGSQSDHNGRHRAGALIVNPPGTEHAVASDEGCVVLAIWQAPVRFTNPDA